MSGRDRIREQLRTRGSDAAWAPDLVICCGHDLDAHDEDGCLIGWVDEKCVGISGATGCPCKVKGWAR